LLPIAGWNRITARGEEGKMAEIVTIEGQEFKKRSPWGAWGLGLITIGIYGIVWYYKINDEARRYLRDDTIKPVLSVLAIIPGVILLVPPFVSYFRTGARIVRMEENAGIQKTVEPVLGLIAALVYSLHIVYYQSHLNTIWERYQAGTPAMPSASTPPAVPPPPPAPEMPPAEQPGDAGTE